MASRFQIEKRDGKLTEASRDVFNAEYLALPDGQYTVEIGPAKKQTATRYRYYFDAFLPVLLKSAGRFYRLVDPRTGSERQPRNTDEMHAILKAIYNPVILNVEGKTRVIAGTTTDLTDSEFIGEYLQQIEAEHAGPPYLVEFISYDEWREMHANGSWRLVKRGFVGQ